MWTDATCELRAFGEGVVAWTRTHLAQAGGVGDQDAWLFDAIGVVRDALNDRLLEQRRA